MKSVKRSVCAVLMFVAVLLAAVPAAAQTESTTKQSGSTVKLKLVEDRSGEPVPFATVSLTVKGAKDAKHYVLTDADGAASIAKVAKGEYHLKAELMGYKTYEKDITVDKPLNLGEVRMSEDIEVLDAAKVTAVGNPIVVKKDTIEYNASSFKTSDNDMLEELLKKLPGVEVSEDGSITANGQTISKITIDGKTFFLDDPSLASKNIPAKIIEKVKVVEKKSDQAMFTGIDDGNEETVIDISVRPGMMQGWFGNIMAGGGHDVQSSDNIGDWRYQGAAMVGRFTDKSQISLILNGNNTNNRGFNDLAGTMMGNMRGGGMGRGQGGWGRGNGITTSWMGGLNGAFTLLDGNMDLSGNYLYNGTRKYVEEESTLINYLDDGSSLTTGSTGHNITNTDGHRFGIRLEHKFSENTSILFEPQVNFGKGNYEEYSDYEINRDAGDGTDPVLTNKGTTLNSGDNSNWTTSGFLLFRQKLGKPGRTVSLMTRYSFSGNELDGINQSFTRTSDSDEGGEAGSSGGSTDFVNQRVDRTSRSYSVNSRLVYTEPLWKNFYLEANYSYGWSRNSSVKNAYDSGNNSTLNPTSFDDIGQYQFENETFDTTYSNDILNIGQTHSAGADLMFQKDKIRAQLGFSANPTITHNVTNGSNYDNTTVKWSPQASFSYDMSENANVRLFYFGSSSQPSTSQLMPVPDNSDPVNISLGNPYLQPYFSHRLRGMFRYSNKKNFISVNGFFGGNYVQDAITSATWYDQNGVKYNIPVNTGGTGNADARIMTNIPFGKSNFSMFSMTYAKWSRSTSYIGTTAFASKAGEYYDSETAEFKYSKFHDAYPNDLSEYADDFTTNRIQSLNFTERLRFTYRNDFVELNLGGRTRISKSWYTIASASTNTTFNNQVNGSMNWTLPWGMNLISQLDYNWYKGYTTAQDPEFIWNAEITQLFYKKKFTLAVKAYDILNKSKNLSVTDASNYHQEVRNNTLGRYIILSLTYRFGNFDNAAKGARRGPGGPGGPPPGR